MGKYKWLLLPPALALLLFVGPLRDPLTGAGNSAPPPTTTDTTDSAAPASPSVAQVASTTIGVLLLGLVIVLALRRYSKTSGKAIPGGLALRNTLRLSSRHAVHMVQVDDHILLLGECDGSLTVLDRAADPDAIEDERQIEQQVEADGAVPRDLVIPRPVTRRTTTPAKPRRKTVVPVKAARTAKPSDLARFQAVLQAARKAQQKV